MRKDVRLGFAVGGVLLAVLVVGVLFFHRNKNAGKTVALDTTGASASSPIDTSAPDLSARTGETGTTPTQIDSHPLNGGTASSDKSAPSDSKLAAAQPTDKGDNWDKLFNSTAEDPVKAQLTTDSPAKPKNKKKHKADAPAPAAAAPATVALAAASNEAVQVPLSETLSDRSAGSSGAPTAQDQPLRHTPVMVAETASARIQKDPPLDDARTHTIASGETFVTIARAAYGDGKYFQAIVDANPSVDPTRLKPGMTIKLPAAANVKQQSKKSSTSSSATSSKSSSALASDGKTYTVQANDSLYKIAKKLYGDGEKHEAIYAANKQVIGPDSTRLKVGMVLTLPEPPSVR